MIFRERLALERTHQIGPQDSPDTPDIYGLRPTAMQPDQVFNGITHVRAAPAFS
jgi:hypothetical protein